MPQSENPTELKDELRQIKGGIALSTEGFSSHRQRLFARFPSSSTKHSDEWERTRENLRAEWGREGRAGARVVRGERRAGVTRYRLITSTIRATIFHSEKRRRRK